MPSIAEKVVMSYGAQEDFQRDILRGTPVMARPPVVNDAMMGQRVRQARIDAGLKQDELAEKICAAGVGWSQGILSRVETGQRPLRYVEALIVLPILGLPMTQSGGR